MAMTDPCRAAAAASDGACKLPLPFCSLENIRILFNGDGIFGDNIPHYRNRKKRSWLLHGCQVDDLFFHTAGNGVLGDTGNNLRFMVASATCCRMPIEATSNVLVGQISIRMRAFHRESSFLEVFD
jgi:hypothetical protein